MLGYNVEYMRSATRTRANTRAKHQISALPRGCRQSRLQTLQRRPFHRQVPLQRLPRWLRTNRYDFFFFFSSAFLNIRLADTGVGPDDDVLAPSNDTSAPPTGAGATSGKYVPPSMRGGSRAPGESLGRAGGGGRDDLPTLRVTNISEDTQENDLRELFGMFGRVARVYVGRDRETGAGKGFAFVSFEERSVAAKAMEKVNGKGYDNLILSVQWSRGCLFLVLVGARYSHMPTEPRPDQK
jgi:RNA recognition motif. (a.k.a. RRM, RBD, or RNP domain)